MQEGLPPVLVGQPALHEVYGPLVLYTTQDLLGKFPERTPLVQVRSSKAQKGGVPAFNAAVLGYWYAATDEPWLTAPKVASLQFFASPDVQLAYV